MSTPMGEPSFDIDPRAFLADDVPTPDEANIQPPLSARAGTDGLERIAEELSAVDAAMVRLDDGRYGSCAVCGGPIGDDRLADAPIAMYCAAHVPPVAE